MSLSMGAWQGRCQPQHLHTEVQVQPGRVGHPAPGPQVPGRELRQMDQQDEGGAGGGGAEVERAFTIPGRYVWNYCLKKKIVIAEEDNFFKQRMTSSSANSIFFKQKMFDNLECDRFVSMKKIHNAKSWVRKVNFKLSVNLLNIEYQSLVFDIEEQIETIFW